jgi:hypothetical protein
MTKLSANILIDMALIMAALMIHGSLATSNDTLFQTSTMSALMQ